MMFKKICIYVLTIISLTNLYTIKVFSYENTSVKTLLVYDKRSYFTYDSSIALSLEQLIAHFPVSINSLSINEYKKNTLKDYDYIFILCIANEFNNKDFLSDLCSFEKNIVWIGKGIDKLLNCRKDYPLKYIGEISDITEILYSNKKFSLEYKKEYSILSPSSDSCKIYCKISNGLNYYPYAINHKNLWHISRVEENSISFYIFADLLYDILKIPPKNANKISIRIDDVNPSTDIKSLKNVGDFLYNEHIPYMISLTPTHLDNNKNLITLSQKKDFTEIIQYLQNHGASIVLNVYSNESLEFWDSEKIKDKISASIKECVYNSIYPIAFTTPNYILNLNSYSNLKKYFSTYIGSFQYGYHKPATVIYPYDLYDTKYFTKFIPENLGYINPDNKLSINEMLYKLNELAIVRDFSSGLILNPSLEIKYLNEIITSLKSYNTPFLDLKQENNWVKYEGLIIKSDEGKVTFLDQSNIFKEKIQTKSKPKSYISIINNFFIIIVFIFCLVFFIIFYISRKRNKKKHLR